MEKPFAAAADHADNPEGRHRHNNIAQSAMNPSIEHCIKRRVFHGVKICLRNFPEKVEEEGRKTKTYFWHSRKKAGISLGRHW
jgi:hypothetical protein